jgi:hypothetical protein
MSRFAALARRARNWAAHRAGTPETNGETPIELDVTDASAMLAWCRQQAPVSRPQYLWGMLRAARTAQGLGVERMAAIEFGVAGGNGLVAMERLAERVEALLPVRIDVYGFDTGTGMPAPVDHRDAPWAIEPGYFDMDEAALRARLRRAELVLGPVDETVPSWAGGEHAPVGFVALDLDFHSSTVHALGVFDAPPDRLLPRVVCYFDDIFGYGWNEFTGARAAIGDFNASHERRKIGGIHGLKYELPASDFRLPWPEKLYLAQHFDHPLFDRSEGRPSERWFDELRLRGA